MSGSLPVRGGGRDLAWPQSAAHKGVCKTLLQKHRVCCSGLFGENGKPAKRSCSLLQSLVPQSTQPLWFAHLWLQLPEPLMIPCFAATVITFHKQPQVCIGFFLFRGSIACSLFKCTLRNSQVGHARCVDSPRLHRTIPTVVAWHLFLLASCY